MKKMLAVSWAVILCLAFVGCSSPKTFNAVYESEDGESLLEFYEDETVELFFDNMLVTGTYKWTAKNTYEIRVSMWFIQMRYTAVREGKTITLTDNSDSSQCYVYTLVEN